MRPKRQRHHQARRREGETVRATQRLGGFPGHSLRVEEAPLRIY